MEQLSWTDFMKVDMRVGTIISAKPFPQARKAAYKLTIDFGADIGIKQTSAQITTLYQPDTLVGQQVIAVVNFPPKQIGPFMSECLVMGSIAPNGTVTLLTTTQAAENGLRVG